MEVLHDKASAKKSFQQSRIYEHCLLYKVQRHFCTKLLIKTKNYYFAKRKPKLVSDNKNFWPTIKPYFSDKGNFSTKIRISEKDCIVSGDRRPCEIINTIKTLYLKLSIISTTTSLPEIIEIITDHPSVKKSFSLKKEECQFKFHSNQNEFGKVTLLVLFQTHPRYLKK